MSGALNYDVTGHPEDVERLIAPEILRVCVARHGEHGGLVRDGLALLTQRLCDLGRGQRREHHIERQLESIVEHAWDQMP